MEAVKIPKKFADICKLIRDGQEEGLTKLNDYAGLENQKKAVLAEVAYFEGDFEKAIELDKEISPYWDEWHYSNIRGEHVAAMSFAACKLGKQSEIIDFFAQQSALAESDADKPEHIKNAYKHSYAMQTEYIKTGTIPYFSEKETYKVPDTLLSMDEMAKEILLKNKKIDIESEKGQEALFRLSISKGSPENTLNLYEKVADNNLSTMWHIHALSICNYLNDNEKTFEIILRMAKQRLWFVAAVTQVRPMEFFTHPSIFPYLGDKDNLRKITEAACNITINK